MRKLIRTSATTSHLRCRRPVHIVENGFNLGSGLVIMPSSIRLIPTFFIMLNSDLRVEDEDWLLKFVDRFRDSDAVILGLNETHHVCERTAAEFRSTRSRADSILWTGRSCCSFRPCEAFRSFFSLLNYFYFEDADLIFAIAKWAFRYGLSTRLMSTNAVRALACLPQFAVENVLDRNRARL